MKKKIAIGLSIVFLLALVASQAFSYGPGYGKGFAPGRTIPGLTPDQVEKVNKLREAHLKDTLELRNNLQLKKVELQNLWLEKEPNRDKIVAKEKEITELKSKLQEKATDYKLELRKVLTPEQWSKWSLGRMHTAMHQGKGFTFGHGPGMMRGTGGCAGR